VGSWLAVAFGLGAAAATRWRGAVHGLIGLATAVATYYLLIGLLETGFRASGATHAASVWGAVAVVAGPLFGLAGAVWRLEHHFPRAFAVAAFAAALIAEAITFGLPRWVRIDQVAGDPGAFVLAGELAIGLALPFLLLSVGERRHGYGLLAVLAVTAGVAIGPVLALIRAVADTF